MIKILKSKEEDLYVKILQYGSTKPEGFTFNEIVRDLSFSELQRNWFHKEITGSDIVTPANVHRPAESIDNDDEIFMLSFESRFKLLEFHELQDAKHSSLIATSLSLIAIIITGVSLLVNQNVEIVGQKTPIEVSTLESGACI